MVSSESLITHIEIFSDLADKMIDFFPSYFAHVYFIQNPLQIFICNFVLADLENHLDCLGWKIKRCILAFKLFQNRRHHIFWLKSPIQSCSRFLLQSESSFLFCFFPSPSNMHHSHIPAFPLKCSLEVLLLMFSSLIFKSCQPLF